MINEAVALSFMNSLTEQMKIQPFFISIDGSNDNELEKMNPVTVWIYDLNHNKVTTMFLDVYLSFFHCRSPV